MTPPARDLSRIGDGDGGGGHDDAITSMRQDINAAAAAQLVSIAGDTGRPRVCRRRERA